MENELDKKTNTELLYDHALAASQIHPGWTFFDPNHAADALARRDRIAAVLASRLSVNASKVNINKD